MATDRIQLPGSARTDPGHPVTGPVDTDEVAQISVYLREQTAGSGLDWVDREAARPPGERRRLSRDEFATAHGAGDDDIAAVRAFAAEHHLTVIDVARGARRVVLAGRLGDLAAAFGTELSVRDHPTSGPYRSRTGELSVPADLDGIITGVFGLDQRPQARTQYRPAAAGATPVSYTPPQVAQLYDYPTTPAAGETIGIIELGGGYREADIQAYFTTLGLTAPTVTAVSVDGGTNAPTTPSGADSEVLLDIEVAASVAPGAAIAVYFAPNTDQGFLDAVTTAIHDTTNHPSVISISWGSAESTWTAQAMEQMEAAFTAGAALGVTVTVAAGDNGSSDSQTDGLAHVDFPASAPHALGCGGTTLEGSGGTITSEVVWNDGASGGATGGGISAQFPLPSYQQGAGVPVSANPGGTAGRGVPDVAGDADPQTGYRIQVDGQSEVIGGTSAVAPLWAGLVALLNAGLGAPVGFLQPLLYASGPAATFHDITQGTNGAYRAGVGWDPCTGLGSPNGTALLGALGPA
jgi:kumamolisin